jgi:WD40 repeat protein
MQRERGYKELEVREYKGSMDIGQGVKEISLGRQLLYAVVATSEHFLVLDLHFQDVATIIRRNAYPRSARLSPCERFLLASFSDNTVFLYDPRTGNPISKILGIPRGASLFALSGNASRIFYSNNNTICLWNVPKSTLEMTSQQWKNINCSAIDDDGQRVALGTYSGQIVVLTLLSPTKVAEMDLSRHKNCVMQLCFSGKNKLFSISYDKVFLTTTIDTTPNGQKSILFEELQLESVPRGIQGVCGLPHLLENKGLFWLVDGNKMRGYS